MSEQKRIIMLNIDSLMPHTLEYMTQSGQAPALKFLMEQGTYIHNMVSSFPTMSVTIDSTILTGTYPGEHRIPALHWFDTETKQFINYGTGFRETFRIGLKKTVRNMLHELNNVHMNAHVMTIYERLAEHGLSAASINSFIYRGNSLRQLTFPRLLRTLSPFTDHKWQVRIPEIFSLGMFAKLRRMSFPTQVTAGNYKYVARELRHLIRRQKLPHFTFCIFQDMDLRLHLKGPLDTKKIKAFDREIEKTLDLYPSWEVAIQENIWMIIGDNGHSATGKRTDDVLVDLRKLLKHYSIAKIKQPVKITDEVAICVNQRMAYIYVLKDHLSLENIAQDLAKDDRIDIIAWESNEAVHVKSGMRRGKFIFSPEGPYEDIYDQSWCFSGDPKLLNLKLLPKNIIDYGNYPDALARLHSALRSHAGRFLVVTAKPGSEFQAELTPTHLSGGAHGSLHRQESVVPFIVAGTEQLPAYNRFVNLKEYILQLLVV